MKQKRLHIAVVNRYFYPVTAGIETSMFETYRQIVRRKHKVTVYTSRNTLTEKNILRYKAQVDGIKVNRYTTWHSIFIPSINYSRLDILSLQNFTLFPHMIILIQVLLRKLVRRKSFAFILETHGGFTPNWNDFIGIRGFIKFHLHNTIGRILINATVDSVRAVSSWEAEELKTAGISPRLIHTIPNGIEQLAYRLHEQYVSPDTKKLVKKTGKYFVQIGRISQIKNIGTPIKALQYLPKHIKFIIIGPVEDEAYYRTLIKLAEKTGVGKRVLFVGVKRGYDKYHIVRNAFAMVHMAEWEAQSIAVLEGMSQGKVCIVSRHPSLQSLIRYGEGGFSVQTFNAKKLAEQIDYVQKHISNHELIQKEKSNANYTASMKWNVTVRLIEDMYLSSIKQKNSIKIIQAIRFATR